MPSQLETLSARIDSLDAQAANIKNTWQDLANFCFPRKAWILTQRTEGDPMDFHRIFDNTAIRANQIMAAGFASHLTNPSAPWFMLATRNRDFLKIKEVRQWFRDVTTQIRLVLNSTNFDSSMQEFYLDSGCFGTAVLFSESDSEKRIRFTSVPVEEILIVEDSRGVINEVHRKFVYTALQAWERWGTNAGMTVIKAITSKTPDFNKKIIITHSVMPRDMRIAGKLDSKNKPFASIWMAKQEKHLISEGGFDEMPYAVGRFYKRTGERWGFSPAMDALADIKMLNAEKKTLIRGAMKVVDPPVILPRVGFIQPFNMNPSGVNYADGKEATDAFKTLDTKGKINVGFDMIQDVKNDINQTFFVDVFKAFSQITKQMTIPEVQRRIAENMVLLGPVVGRYTQEVFDPTITRAFNILFRQGILPPPPAAIQGQELDIIYISQLALAQRAVEINSIQAFLNDIGAISAFAPEVLDIVDADQATRSIAEIRNISPDLLKSVQQIKEIRQARAEAQAIADQKATAQEAANVVETATNAERNTRT